MLAHSAGVRRGEETSCVVVARAKPGVISIQRAVVMNIHLIVSQRKEAFNGH